MGFEGFDARCEAPVRDNGGRRRGGDRRRHPPAKEKDRRSGRDRRDKGQYT